MVHDLLSDPSINRFATSMSPIGLFYATTQIGQRLGGALGRYYGGKGSGIAGLAIVTASSVAAQAIKTRYVDPILTGRTSKPTPSRELLHRTYLSLICFLALGLKSFDAVLPSSVITLGSFAKWPNLPSSIRGAVDATSDVATSGQRMRIQQLGRLYGCHHCGSKQMFSSKNFIADHMPPSMQVKIANKVWWRRMFGFKVRISLLSHG
jgi:hypothetical protein